MDSLFLLMGVLYLGMILLAMYLNRNHIYNRGPLFWGYLMRLLWTANKKTHYYILVTLISVMIIIISAQIDLRKVDFGDPANIVIMAIIIFIVTPFYWLFWPTKKRKSDNSIND